MSKKRKNIRVRKDFCLPNTLHQVEKLQIETNILNHFSDDAKNTDMNHKANGSNNQKQEPSKHYRFFIWKLLTIEGNGYNAKEMRKLIRSTMTPLVIIVLICATSMLVHPPLWQFIHQVLNQILEYIKA